MDTTVRRWLGRAGGLALVFALVGAGLFALRPAAYSTTATTSISPAARADASVLQGVSATIFMLMPVYAEEAQNAQVITAGAQASGLTTDQVSQGLTVERSIDSSVLTWTMIAPSAEQATLALDGATRQFSAILPESGPQSGGKPLLSVAASNATPPTTSPLTPLAGALIGAVLGLLVAAAWRLLTMPKRRGAAAGWDDVERALETPVVAELNGVTDSRRQWRYVAAHVSQSLHGRPVGLVGLTNLPTQADVSDLSAALRREGSQSSEVISAGVLASPEGAALTGLGAVVVLADGADPRMPAAAPDAKAMRRSITAPVVVILDSRGSENPR